MSSGHSSSAAPARAGLALASLILVAKSSFLQGDDWAYTAGIAAILIGAALVFVRFPKRDEERRLLAGYHSADTA